jgi:hypothetical protein
MVLAAFSRLIPHPPNFAPITAIALFSSFYVTNKFLVYALPIGVMILSDLFIGFSRITFFVYFAFLIVSFIGTQSKKPSFLAILISSISFFIITNFGVWILGGYPKTWTGLVTCYTMAIPFFKNSLMGDFFYSGVMILSYSLSRKTILRTV